MTEKIKLTFSPCGPVLRNYFNIAPTTENGLDRAICIYTDEIPQAIKAVLDSYMEAFTGPDTQNPWFYEKIICTQGEVTYKGMLASPTAPVALIGALNQAMVMLFEISAPDKHNLFIPVRTEEEFLAWYGVEHDSNLVSYTGDIASIMANAESLSQITGNTDVTQMLMRINPKNKDFPLWLQFVEVTKDNFVLSPAGLWSPIFPFALKIPSDKFKAAILDGSILLWGSIVAAAMIQSKSVVGDAVDNVIKEAIKS